MNNNRLQLASRFVLTIFIASAFTEIKAEPAVEKAAPAVSSTPNAKPAETTADTTADKKAKRTMKLADDAEEPPLAEKDAKDYQLSTKRLVAEYSELDQHPYDRGEHFMISALFGAIGGGVVGGAIGLSQYSTNDETGSLNSLYTFGGVGAGVGVLAGLTTAIFETRQIEQFAIGKFLLKFSWYGTFAGGILGAGIGIIPYSKNSDLGEILSYAGYGAAIGLIAGLTVFAIELPGHLRLYSYNRLDQGVVALAWTF